MPAKLNQHKNSNRVEATETRTNLNHDEFFVDYILTERKTTKGIQYLIKWQGYGEEESTWQISNDITQGKDEIIARWNEDKKRIAEGFKQPFDLADFEMRKLISKNHEKAVPSSKKKKHQAARKQVAKASRRRAANNIFVTSDDDSDGNTGSTTEHVANVLPASEMAQRDEFSPITSTNGKNNLDGTSAPDAVRKRKGSPTDQVKTPSKKTKGQTRATESTSNVSAAAVRDENLESSKPSPKASDLTNAENSQTDQPSKAPEDAQKIFGPFENERKLRKRKSAQNGRIYAPSHVQAIVKQNQDGKAPDPNSLILHNPGEMATRPSTHQVKVSPAAGLPVTPTTLLEQPRRQSTQLESIPYSPLAQSIPLVCSYFFLDKICPETERKCRFLHQEHQIYGVAPPELHQQAREQDAGSDGWPKFNDPVIVCGHERRMEGNCFRGNSCLYAHWKPLKGKWLYHDHLTQRKKTCRFWLKNECHYSAEDCSFAHERLDEIASPGPATGVKTMTCAFWFDATYKDGPPCRRTEKDCKFAHELKSMLASKPNERDAPIPIASELLRFAPKSTMDAQLTSSLHIDLPPPTSNSVPPQGVPTRRSSMPTIGIEQLSLKTPGTPTSSFNDDGNHISAYEDSQTVFSVMMNMGKVKMPANFLGLNQGIQSSLQTNFGDPQGVVPRVSPWRELEMFTFPLYHHKIASGKLRSTEDVIGMAELADHLAHEGCGLVLQARNMIVVLFPSRGNLEDEKADVPDETIGYEIRTSMELVINDQWNQGLDVSDEGDVESWFRHTFEMNFEDIFKWPTHPESIEKNIFLLLDDDKDAEIEALGRAFRWLGSTVYIPDISGSWNEFKARNEGVVIFDERLIKYRNIPFLSHLLLCRFNFFRLTTDPTTGKLGLTKLFKTGHTILLTDEVLIQEPEKILDVIKHIKDKNMGKAPKQATRRLFARPGVTDWLLKLAEDNMKEHKAGNVSRALLWDEISNLVPIDSPAENLEFIDHVIYEPSWLTNHAEDFARDPSAATLALLNAFNLTFCQYGEYSRNWIVLHPSHPGALEQAETWSNCFENMRFMTVDDFKTKLIAR